MGKANLRILDINTKIYYYIDIRNLQNLAMKPFFGTLTFKRFRQVEKSYV